MYTMSVNVSCDDILKMVQDLALEDMALLADGSVERLGSRLKAD